MKRRIHFKPPCPAAFLILVAMVPVACFCMQSHTAYAQGIPGFEFGEEEEEEEPAGPMPAPGDAAPGENVGPPAGDGQDLDIPAAGAAEENEDIAKALAEPVCDMVLLGRDSFNKPILRKIRLVSQPVDIQSSETYRFEKYQKTGSSKLPPLTGKRIDAVLYYEWRMIDKAATALAVQPRALVSGSRPPEIFFATQEHRDRVKLALAVLKKALAEHQSAVQRVIRTGPAWEAAVRQPLKQALFNIRYREAQWLFQQGRHDQALEICDQLRQTLGAASPVHSRMKAIYEALLVKPAEQAEAAGQYETARQNLSGFFTRFGVDLEDGESRAMQLRRRLMQRAGEIARSAGAAATLREQREKLALAESVWPGHREIDTARQQLNLRQQTLEVAYQVLPQSLSPFEVRSDAERHAHHLQFESLVRWRRDAMPGPHFQTELALGRPVPLAKGRRFHLPEVSWSDNTRQVVAEDVEWSYQIFSKLQPPGYSRAWSEMIVDIRTQDRSAVEIMLARDFWQPLAAMQFPVLPKHHFPAQGADRAELDAFAADPVGTGPYRLSGQTADEVRFSANPFYRRRKDLDIEQIVFHQYDAIEAVEEFRKDNLHLIYGLQQEQVRQLDIAGLTVKKIRPQSVYFLAPNYRATRRDTGLHNANFRLALANAIDRTTILNAHFRAPGRELDHAPLHGPFPCDSWAYNDKAAEFSKAKAAAFLTQAKQELRDELRPIQLVFPARDQDVLQACEQIKQSAAAIGIQIELAPVEPEAMFDRVMVKHAFDLVYWRHDFTGGSYWLWPLLDPQDAGARGANFMGYKPNLNLQTMFTTLSQHKQFRTIQNQTHQIHTELSRNAVVIPLWQLDTYVAVHRSVENARLDAVRLFDSIENWRISQ